MNIIADNIIWNLQTWGGISVYWKELQSRIISDNEIKKYWLKTPQPLKSKVSTPRLNQNSTIHYQTNRYIPQRYSPINYNFPEKHIFHSSYYRYSKNPKAINISTVHDFTYETHFSGLKKEIHVLHKKRALLNSQGIICISDYTRDVMFDLYPFTKEKEVITIYNGISENFNSEKIKTHSTTLKTSFNDYILYVGDRKAKYKNFNLVIEIVKKLKKSLVIVGGGELSTREKKMLQENIKYQHQSHVEESDLISLYQNALFLLYPSESEGFGIPIIEAQSLGCPVVTSNFTCIPEISGGHVIELKELSVKNAIDQIKKIEEEEFRLNLIKRGRENSKKYHWDTTFNSTKKFYNKLLKL